MHTGDSCIATSERVPIVLAYAKPPPFGHPPYHIDQHEKLSKHIRLGVSFLFYYYRQNRVLIIPLVRPAVVLHKAA